MHINRNIVNRIYRFLRFLSKYEVQTFIKQKSRLRIFYVTIRITYNEPNVKFSRVIQKPLTT